MPQLILQYTAGATSLPIHKMKYTVQAISSGFFGDAEKWLHLQVWNGAKVLVSEEIWTHERGDWELKDILVGDSGMQPILFKEHENNSALFDLLHDIWRNRDECPTRQVCA